MSTGPRLIATKRVSESTIACASQALPSWKVIPSAILNVNSVRSDRHGDREDQRRDPERDPRAGDDAAEEAAAQLVGAARVRERRRRQPVRRASAVVVRAFTIFAAPTRDDNPPLSTSAIAKSAQRHYIRAHSMEKQDGSERKTRCQHRTGTSP
jgi:hypothetical protein